MMRRIVDPVLDLDRLLESVAIEGGQRRQARGRRAPHEVGRMNKLETAYAAHLDGELRAGRVLWWGFEVVKLKLAEKTFYAPDFSVLMADGGFELHEVKGHWEDDARVKWKATAERFWMFAFVAVTRPDCGGWKFERY